MITLAKVNESKIKKDYKILTLTNKNKTFELYKNGKETEHIKECLYLHDFLSKYDIINCSISDTDIVKSIKPNSYFIVKDELMYTGKNKVEITDEKYIINISMRPTIDIKIKIGTTLQASTFFKNLPNSSIQVSDLIPAEPKEIACIIYYDSDNTSPIVNTDIYKCKGIGKIEKYILASILAEKYKYIMIANSGDYAKQALAILRPSQDIVCLSGFNFQSPNDFLKRKKVMPGEKCQYTSSNGTLYPSFIFTDYIKWITKEKDNILEGTEDLMFCTWCHINNINIMTSSTVNERRNREQSSGCSDIEIKNVCELFLENIIKYDFPFKNRKFIEASQLIRVHKEKIILYVYLHNTKLYLIRRINAIANKRKYTIMYKNYLVHDELSEYRKELISHWNDTEVANDNDIIIPINILKIENIDLDKYTFKELEKYTSKDILISKQSYRYIITNIANYANLSLENEFDQIIDLYNKGTLSLCYRNDTLDTYHVIKDYSSSDDKSLVIIFSDREYFNFYLESYCKNRLFIREDSKNWHLKGIKNKTTNVEDTVKYLKEKIQESKAKNVITLGYSAGGFAAILYGKLLNVRKIIAIDPDYNLNNKTLQEDLLSQKKYFNLGKTKGFCKDIIIFSNNKIPASKNTTIYNYTNVILDQNLFLC